MIGINRYLNIGPALRTTLVAVAPLATASLLGSWNTAEAEREFVRALELNPKHIQALDSYAFFFLTISEGRIVEGMERAKLALVSDSLSVYTHAMYALTCLHAGKIAEGIEVSKRAVELDADSFLAHWVLLSALGLSGQFEAAVALYCEMQARARREHVSPALLALVASAINRENDALRHAREARRDPACLLFFSRHCLWQRWLYSYPWFREIIAQIGRREWLRDSAAEGSREPPYSKHR